MKPLTLGLANMKHLFAIGGVDITALLIAFVGHRFYNSVNYEFSPVCGDGLEMNHSQSICLTVNSHPTCPGEHIISVLSKDWPNSNTIESIINIRGRPFPVIYLGIVKIDEQKKHPFFAELVDLRILLEHKMFLISVDFLKIFWSYLWVILQNCEIGPEFGFQW